MPQRRAVGKNAGAALAKRKRNSAIYPDQQIVRCERIKVRERVAPWRVKGVSEREHGEERVDPTVKDGRFQGGQGGQARRAFLGEVEGSMSGRGDVKTLQDNLQSLGFTPSLAKPKMENEIGRRRARS